MHLAKNSLSPCHAFVARHHDAGPICAEVYSMMTCIFITDALPLTASVDMAFQATKQRRALDPDKRPPKPSKPDISGNPEEPLIAERDEVPEEVNARVLQRILIFAGVPVFTGIILLPLIVYLKVGVDLPSCWLFSQTCCMMLAVQALQSATC